MQIFSGLQNNCCLQIQHCLSSLWFILWTLLYFITGLIFSTHLIPEKIRNINTVFCSKIIYNLPKKKLNGLCYVLYSTSFTWAESVPTVQQLNTSGEDCLVTFLIRDLNMVIYDTTFLMHVNLHHSIRNIS